MIGRKTLYVVDDDDVRVEMGLFKMASGQIMETFWVNILLRA